MYEEIDYILVKSAHAELLSTDLQRCVCSIGRSLCVDEELDSRKTLQTVCILQVNRLAQKMGARKKRKVNTAKIILAFRQLFASGSINILRVDENHQKLLAKRFKISQSYIKGVLNSSQPFVPLNTK